MQTIKGTTSGSIKNTAYQIPCTIKSIGVYNRTGGAIVVSVGINSGTTDYYFKSFNLAATLTAGSSDLVLTNVRVPANWSIMIVASGSCDYFLTIE